MKYVLAGEQTNRLKFRLVKETDYVQWLVFHQDPKTSEHGVSPFETAKDVCKNWYKK